MTLSERLCDLYEQRAILIAKLDAQRALHKAEDEAGARRMEAAANDRFAAMRIGLEGLPAAYERNQARTDTEREIAWVERQILALLGNAGLGQEATNA